MSETKQVQTLDLKHWAAFLLIFIAMSILAQMANFWHLLGSSTAPTANLWVMIKGFAVLYVGTMLGLVLTKYVRIGWPAVIWVSLVMIVAALPWSPTHEFVVAATAPVALLPMASPILAYAGLAIARNELQLFKDAGWKMAIIACLAFVGSFFFSALIAQTVLRMTGQI